MIGTFLTSISSLHAPDFSYIEEGLVQDSLNNLLSDYEDLQYLCAAPCDCHHGSTHLDAQWVLPPVAI